MAKVSRRAFIQSAGAVAATLAVPGCDRLTRQAESRRASYSFFTADEAAFIEPAVARLIPADDLGPGALEAGVPTFMDRQLAGAWGAGAGLYRTGATVRHRIAAARHHAGAAVRVMSCVRARADVG